jgi:hypothetical protein
MQVLTLILPLMFPPLIHVEHRRHWRIRTKSCLSGGFPPRVLFVPANGEEHREPRSGMNLWGGISLPSFLLLQTRKKVAIRRKTISESNHQKHSCPITIMGIYPHFIK